jgi:hypothetical protein
MSAVHILYPGWSEKARCEARLDSKPAKVSIHREPHFLLDILSAVPDDAPLVREGPASEQLHQAHKGQVVSRLASKHQYV